MCVVSAIHDYGRSVPDDIWRMPNVLPVWDDLIRRGQEFDQIGKQPHCEDPLKVLDLERIRDVAEKAQKERDAARRQKHGEPVDEGTRVVEAPEGHGSVVEGPAPEWATQRIVELEAETATLKQRVEDVRHDLAVFEQERDQLLELLATARAQIAAQEEQIKEMTAANAEVRVARADWQAHTISEAKQKLDDVFHERTQLLALLARSSKADGERVWIATSSDVDTLNLYIELPSGQVRFQFKAEDASLFAGLPFGTNDEYDGHDAAERWERVNAAWSL